MAKDWERLRAVGSKGAEKLFDEGKAYTDLIYRAEWIAIDGAWECTRCGCRTLKDSAFCPDCGADMREP